MTRTLHPARSGPRLAALACAAALACSAGAGHAGVATLTIDTVFVTSSSAFVSVVDAYQHFGSDALDGGGSGGGASDSRTESNWNTGSNVSASTSRASATGVLAQFVNGSLTTAGFSLNATTLPGGIYSVPTPPNDARALSNLAGAFSLVDFDGVATAGDITLQVFYTMSVFDAINRAGSDYAQVSLNFSAFDDDESYTPDGVGLLSTDFAGGGSGDVSGFFSWTFNLASGEWAGFNLDGTAVSRSAVPEPGALALVGLALAGLSLTSRASRTRVLRR